jgi:hypothetical protein
MSQKFALYKLIYLQLNVKKIELKTYKGDMNKILISNII